MKKIVLAASLFLLTLAAHAQATASKVYSVFIYSFAKSLQWPEDQNDFVIGVVDFPALKTELDQAVGGKLTTTQKKIVIKDVANVKDAGDCKILFLSKPQAALLPKITSNFPTSPVLIISESEGQAKEGSGISFFYEGSKLRFQFNLGAIEGRGIKMPSNLKSLGVQVD